MRALQPFVDGEFIEGDERRVIASPFSGQPVAEVSFAGAAAVERALAAGKLAERPMAALPAHERRRALCAIAAGVRARAAELAAVLSAEAGKPITFATVEVERAATTFELAAEEAWRTGERGVELDAVPAGRGRFGVVRRFARGLVAAITPFNFPLNLVAHKLAPALAFGCPVLLKPPPEAPCSALLLAELCREADLPRGALQVVPAEPAVADALVTDERPRVLSFTGSARVGWDMKARAGTKRVVLELGGDASALVHDDARLEHAAERVALGAYAYAGQVCISVQHVLVQERVYERFRALLLEAIARDVVVGDPSDPRTVCGPLIDERAAARVLAWIGEAKERGARLLCGGEQRGRVIAPALLEGVPHDAALGCQEAFGPVATLAPYRDLDEALARVNASAFGLQAGVFTDSIAGLWKCYAALEVGAVIHDDAPTFRVDHMPYGGEKASGEGREGPAFALDDYTSARMLAVQAPR